MSVFVRTTETMHSFGSNNGNADLSGGVNDVVGDLRANLSGLTGGDRTSTLADDNIVNGFRLLTPGAVSDVGLALSFNSDAIPVFMGGRVLMAGDILELKDPFTTAPGLTVRVYDADPMPGPGNVSLAMATLAADSPDSVADDTGEFFLTGDPDWLETQVADSGNWGYVEPNCGTGTLATGGLSCIPAPEIVAPVTGGTSGGNSERRGDNFIGGIGFLVLFGVLYNFNPDDPDALTFSPDFGYSVTESGYSANVGGRMDFATDNWRLYLTAGQTNRNGDFGDFAYESGGEYRSDSGLWTTAFSESVSGDIANYDFALSADVQNGIWNLSPTYRFNSRLDWEKNESDSRNSLNIESVLRMNRWLIRPTAGFNWRRMNEFGNSAKFGIAAEHRF